MYQSLELQFSFIEGSSITKKTFKTSLITNTTIHLNLSNNELKLIVVYKSPYTVLHKEDIAVLLNFTQNVIIAGDLKSTI